MGQSEQEHERQRADHEQSEQQPEPEHDGSGVARTARRTQEVRPQEGHTGLQEEVRHRSEALICNQICE